MDQTSPTLERDEVINAIKTLSPANWARLRVLAQPYAWRSSFDVNDLIQEACRRALEPSGRKCPRTVDFIRFLAETIRSIANGETEKGANRISRASSSMEIEESPKNEAIGCQTMTAEDAMLIAENELSIWREISAIFPDDSAARDILEGILAGFEGEELRELSGLTKTEYDSKRRLIRRRLNKYSLGVIGHDKK